MQAPKLEVNGEYESFLVKPNEDIEKVQRDLQQDLIDIDVENEELNHKVEKMDLTP